MTAAIQRRWKARASPPRGTSAMTTLPMPQTTVAASAAETPAGEFWIVAGSVVVTRRRLRPCPPAPTSEFDDQRLGAVAGAAVGREVVVETTRELERRQVESGCGCALE